LFLLFFLALLPRITGLLTFFNADENWSASVRVLTGELSGGAGVTLPLINYLNAASYVLLYAIGRLIGVWHGTADFRAQYFSDRTPFIFSGRLVAASLGALSAPLAALIASRLGLTRRSSLIVGGLVALLPVNIWLSHVAKPDSGAAFGVLLLAWSILRKLDDPEAKGADVMVGVALAIAVSFKQTVLFAAAPALAGFVALLRWDCKLPWSRIVRGLLVVLAACVLASVLFNIGVLLDIGGFLDYQRVIVMVQRRPATAYQLAMNVLPIIAGNITGLTAAGLMAWLFAPCVRHDRKFLLLWASSAFAYAVVSAISGSTIQPRYFLPYDVLAFMLGCVAVLSLSERNGLFKLVGVSLAIAVLACEAVGSVEVMRQAMTTPLSARCAQVIKAIADPEQDRILAANVQLVGVPVSAAADDEDRARLERLAKKYGVKLPDRAKEKISRRGDRARGYFVRQLPFAHGGSEDLPREALEKSVKPSIGLWPFQDEEWELDYWTTRGFSIFIVLDELAHLNSGVALYRSLHQQIKERCELVAVLPTTRPLFFEGEARIYRIRDPHSREQRTAPGSSNSASRHSVRPLWHLHASLN